jgi:ketosteroid isomerase-like protein
LAVPPEFWPPSQSDSGGNAVDKLDNPILQVLDDYKAAVFAKDVDSFVALYDRDVLVFDIGKFQPSCRLNVAFMRPF